MAAGEREGGGGDFSFREYNRRKELYALPFRYPLSF